MLYYPNTTQTPNRILDLYLKNLSGAEVKIILVIIRRTLGLIDKQNPKQRVQRAWISQKLFVLITGLSGRAVSSAVESLLSKGLIVVTDNAGTHLLSASSRKAANRLYYAVSPVVLARP